MIVEACPVNISAICLSVERMNKIVSRSILLLSLSLSFVARGTSFLPVTTEQHLQISDGVFRGSVVSSESYRDPADGFIYTRTVIRVEEVFKGKLPPLLKLIHRGGTIGDSGEADGFAPQFKVGDERLLFVSRRADGTLSASRGGASAITLRPAGGFQTASLAAAGHLPFS